MTAWHILGEIFKSLDHEGAAEHQVVVHGKMYQGAACGAGDKGGALLSKGRRFREKEFSMLQRVCAGVSRLLLGRQDTKKREKLGLGGENMGNQDWRQSACEARKSTHVWDTAEDGGECCAKSHEVAHVLAWPLEHRRRLLWEGQHSQPNRCKFTSSQAQILFQSGGMKWDSQGHTRTWSERCLSLPLTGQRKGARNRKGKTGSAGRD